MYKGQNEAEKERNVRVYIRMCIITVLEQALANYGPWDKYDLPPVYRWFSETDILVYLHIV